jgi:M6 family metalloprotease-like protein
MPEAHQEAYNKTNNQLYNYFYHQLQVMSKNHAWYLPLLLVGGLWAASQPAWAIKANRKTVTLRQPDGTTFKARIHGDENFHYTTTLDGFMIAKGKDSFYHYVDFDAANKSRILSDLQVRDAADRTEAEISALAAYRPARLVQAEMLEQQFKLRAPLMPEQILGRSIVAPRTYKRALAAAARSGANAATAADAAATDEVTESEYLVVLVSFKDLEFQHTADDFDLWLNQQGYSVNGGTGSVKDYYRDNSMGQFVPNFTVVGPYTLNYDKAYYSANDDYDADVNPKAMIKEAMQKAKIANPTMSFKKFDNDGDGYVDNVYVIYAGYGEASSGNDDDMWPHSATMGDEMFRIDSRYINNYSCSAELVGSSGSDMDGIGTFTHEFGHILGLRDMYDTDDYTDGLGLDPGDYSLYASGSYNNDSRTPPYLMAFERLQLGWAKEGEDIVALQGAEDVTLPNIRTNKARYINAQPESQDTTGYEWFLFENRQQSGWDTYIPAHGMIITHYDYTADKQALWKANGPNNNASHRCLYIVPADGIDDTNSRNGDTYPGRSGNTSFTDTSSPSALNWNEDPINMPITNILEQDSLIYFQVKGGTSQWNVIRTLVPTEIRDTSVVLAAELVQAQGEVKEMGFCWSSEKEPTVTDDHVTVPVSNTPSVRVDGFTAGMRYNVKAYMVLADGTVVYGSPILIRTECPTVYPKFHTDFTSWTDGEPDCWEIVDNNADGTTWEFDDSYQALVYDFNYWNDADDWLISKRRFHIPTHGVLTFCRAVTDLSCIENLEIYVSTRTSNIEDFYLYKRYSFADNVYTQVYEETDLSEFAGRDIYLAFRACSEKMQNNIWLWDMAITDKLQTPTITKFESKDGQTLDVEWTPVDSAEYYYLYFGRQTDETNTVTEFAPIELFEKAQGNIDLAVGSIFFKGSGVVELEMLPDSLQDLKFMLTTSGPIGTSTLRVEGSVDGNDWFQIGPKLSCSEYDTDGQECDWTGYVAGMGYRKLRFTFDHQGRNGRIKYLTLTYNDGKVLEDLSAGRVSTNAISIVPVTADEFTNGTYVVWVAAGDGFFFYDESEYAYYTATGKDDTTTGINAITAAEAGVSVMQRGEHIAISGLKQGEHISLFNAAGSLLYEGTARRETVLFPASVKGPVLIGIDGADRTIKTKVIVK